MTDQVQEVKRKADIVAIVAERVKLKKAGRNFAGLCPFHSEKTPSFNVSPELQIFKCFGCNEAGDVFTFLEKYEGMEFGEALRFVADRVGVKLVEYRPTHQSQKRERYLEILNLAAEFYQYLLIEHKIGEEARSYLKERGVWKQTMETWRLGYAPQGWDNLYKYLVNKKKYDSREVEEVGLITKSSIGSESSKSSTSRHYDRFRGRVMFPLSNQRGQVLGFAGRLLAPPSLKVSEGREAKYVNTSETELYHKSELLFGLSVTKEDIRKADRVVVVEGEFDAISSWQHGVKNVVAIKGSAFTEEQIHLLSRYTKNIALALDADKAGDEATKRSITLLDKMEMNVRVVELEGGKDPDEIARNDKEAWKGLVANAVNIYDFYIRSALKRWDVGSGEGKREISRNLVPIVAQIVNAVEQAHYMQKMARVLGVNEEVIYREIQRVRVTDNKITRYQDIKPDEEKKDEGKGIPLEEYTVGLLFGSDGKLIELLAKLDPEWFEAVGVKRLYKILVDQGKDFVGDDRFDVAGFVQVLPDELKSLAEKIWLKVGGNEVVDIEKEFNGSVRQFKKRFTQKRLAELTGKMKVLESKKAKTDEEKADLKVIRSEFVEVSKGLMV